MSEHTMEHDMPRTVTTTPLPSETVSKLKLYTEDYDEAVKLQKKAQPVFRQITLQEIYREAIHAGLPAVVKRYTAAVEAAAKADKEKE